jgi:hypothetical protein
MARKGLLGTDKFVSLLGKLIEVPKRELDAEMAKYERRKAAKKARAARRTPKRGR